jgi:hypothetical protein
MRAALASDKPLDFDNPQKSLREREGLLEDQLLSVLGHHLAT